MQTAKDSIPAQESRESILGTRTKATSSAVKGGKFFALRNGRWQSLVDEEECSFKEIDRFLYGSVFPERFLKEEMVASKFQQTMMMILVYFNCELIYFTKNINKH